VIRKHCRQNTDFDLVGLFIASVIILTAFSGWVLLAPPSIIAIVLDIKAIPPEGKFTLLIGVILNVATSFVFERYLQEVFGHLIGLLPKLRDVLRGNRQSTHYVYKQLETGMANAGGV
jgi:hypothetical protein